MASVQIDGSAVTNHNASTENNGGVIRHAGTVDATQGAPGITSKSLGDGDQQFACSVVNNSSDTDTPYGGSSFGINQGHAQIQLVGNVNYDSSSANRNGLTVAGVSRTAMRGGASDVGDRTGFHKIETVRTTATATAIREGRWVAFSGAFRNEGAVASTDGLWDNDTGAAAAANADHAASGTLGRPDQHGGFITLHHGNLGSPTNATDDSRMVYKAKHGTTS